MSLIRILNPIFFLLFSVSAGITVFRSRRREERPARAEYALSEKQYLLLLLLIAAVGIFLRVWRFGAVPGGFNQDGAMAAVDGKALADYGTDRFGTRFPCHLYAWGFGQMSSLLSYLIAPFVRLGGLSPVTARLPQLLVSLAGGVFFFLFTGNCFGRRTALIAAALVCISPWHLLQSRWALDCNLFPHFFIAGLYFLERGLSSHRPLLYVSMVFFGLCMYCYGIALYTIPPLLLGLCLFLLGEKLLRPSEALLCAAVYLLIAWPFLLTMAVNAFGLETISFPFVTVQRFPDSVRSGDILLFSPQPGQQLLRNLRSLAEVVLLQKKDLPWNDMAGFGTRYLFSAPLTLCGAVFLCRARGPGKWLSISALCAAILAGLLTNEVNVNRINVIFYFLLLLDAVGLAAITRELSFSALPCACMYALAAALMVTAYFTDYAESIEHSFYQGFGEALLAAEKSGSDRLYITADTQYSGSRAVSEILTLFYAETDALYFQGKSSSSGGRDLLPYAERFQYCSMSPEIAAKAAAEQAACVIRPADAEYFTNDFTILFFGDYSAAIPLT